MAAGVTDRQWLLTTGNVFRSERFFSKRSRSLGGRVRAEVARRSAGESSIQGWGESSRQALFLRREAIAQVRIPAAKRWRLPARAFKGATISEGRIEWRRQFAMLPSLSSPSWQRRFRALHFPENAIVTVSASTGWRNLA